MSTSSSSPSTLKLALLPEATRTQKSTPNLMPFQLSYTGKAPISTYFRVKDAPSEVGMPTAAETANLPTEEGSDTPTGSKDATKDAINASEGATGEGSSTGVATTSLTRSDSVATVIVEREEPDTSSESKSTTPPKEDASTVIPPLLSTIPSSTTLAASSSSSFATVAPQDSVTEVSASLATLELPHASSLSQGKRTVSSFRGRKIYGLDVELPEGYTGVVLRKPIPSTKAASAPAPKKSRAQANAMDVDDEEGEENVEELQISEQFSSFTLWHPDIPVVERDDVYVRSIKEWTALAAVIHDTD